MTTEASARSGTIWPRARRVLAWIHLWAGVLLSIPLVLVCVSGSILVFHDELDTLFGNGPPRGAASGEFRPVGEIVAAARAGAPAGMNPTTVSMPGEPGAAATVRFSPQRAPVPRGDGPVPGQPSQPAGPPGFAGSVPVHVDPITLAVLGAGPVFQPGANPGFMRLMHNLHGNLLIAGRTGREIVGWLGVVMLILGCSGIVMWWPRRGQWRQAFTFSLKARTLRLNRELHGAFGIWGLAVHMIISFSGVYLVFPQTLATVIPGKPLANPNSISIEPARGAARLDIDGVVALAIAVAPDARVRGVSLGNRPNQPDRVTLTRAGHEHGQPMITAFVDPYRRAVTEVRDPRIYTWGQTMMAWQRPLHEGAGLGWVWRILTFLSGILPVLFVVTGITMWWIKRRNRRSLQRQRVEALKAAE